MGSEIRPYQPTLPPQEGNEVPPSFSAQPVQLLELSWQLQLLMSLVMNFLLKIQGLLPSAATLSHKKFQAMHHIGHSEKHLHTLLKKIEVHTFLEMKLQTLGKVSPHLATPSKYPSLLQSIKSAVSDLVFLESIYVEQKEGKPNQKIVTEKGEQPTQKIEKPKDPSDELLQHTRMALDFLKGNPQKAGERLIQTLVTLKESLLHFLKETEKEFPLAKNPTLQTFLQSIEELTQNLNEKTLQLQQFFREPKKEIRWNHVRSELERTLLQLLKEFTIPLQKSSHEAAPPSPRSFTFTQQRNPIQQSNPVNTKTTFTNHILKALLPQPTPTPHQSQIQPLFAVPHVSRELSQRLYRSKRKEKRKQDEREEKDLSYLS